MADLLARPDTATAPTGNGDDLVHITCCDPDTALCGVDVTGEPYVNAPIDCWDCELVVLRNRPCGKPFCRLRQAWREWKERLRG